MATEASFGRWLQRRRKALDLTQAALAQRVGCAAETLRKIEADARRPSRQIAERLADALELPEAERTVFIRAARAELSTARLAPPTQSVPQATFVLVAPDLRAKFPALRTLEARPNNLPAQTTPLVGRTHEVEAISKLLRRPEVRLVTLTGPGGTGKTRLALQAATELLDACPDGVWFIDLAPLHDPGLVVATFAQALAVQATSNQPLIDQLGAYLRPKHMLLLLDNFEQVVDAAPYLADLLATAPNLNLLVTSRVALHLQGEREYVVPPLALPDPQQPLPLDILSQYAAVELFVQRAQAVKMGFQVTDANAPAVAEICVRLDGLPLAIELAAARMKLFSPHALLSRLTRRLALLTGGARDLPARQQTMRATIDWSYELLTPEEQTLFARLGVFAGGCTLEAAETVCNANGDRPMEILNGGIAVLVNQSLIRPLEGPDGEPRFMMLETIREYALERLEHGGEAETLRLGHAQYFLALAEAAEPRLRGQEQDLWLARLETEHSNLRTALAWCLEGTAAVQLVRRARSSFGVGTTDHRRPTTAVPPALPSSVVGRPSSRLRANI